MLFSCYFFFLALILGKAEVAILAHGHGVGNGGKAWVAGDISPTGMFLSPLGEASFEELVDIYTEQAAGLEKAGVDLFVIETMMTLSDARAAVLAVRSVSEKPMLLPVDAKHGKVLDVTSEF